MSTEKVSAKTLPIKSIGEVVETTKTYIDNRRNGKEKSLKVGSEKINKTFLAGFDWNRIITIAGMPGSGKSTLARQWVKEMIECNPEEKFRVLSFQFEMMGQDEVARDLSSKTNKSLKDIYSAEEPITDKDFKIIEQELEKIRSQPIDIVDNIGTVANIKDTILYYVSQNDLVKKGEGLVVTIDHTLLVKPSEGEDEKVVLDRLMHTLIALKKYLSSVGLRTIFIVISQLNRNIESSERILNPKLHFPNKSDLFGASSVYYSSDYVIIIHRPALIEGMGNWYGSSRTGFPNGLPVFNPKDAKQPMVYLHVIKERFGNPKIIAMVDELSSAKITEYK